LKIASFSGRRRIAMEPALVLVIVFATFVPALLLPGPDFAAVVHPR